MGRDGIIEFVIAWAIDEGRKMAAGFDCYLQAKISSTQLVKKGTGSGTAGA